MGVVAWAVIAYGMVAAYLLLRGAGPWLVAKVVLSGLFTGLVLSATLGLLYYGIVLVKPAGTFAALSIPSVFLAAAYLAREKILGNITPLGIVLLNIAVNFVPAAGPIPVSLRWLAAPLAEPFGPLRSAVHLLVVYLPAIIALLALRRGPPGPASVRFVLGLWVCWTGIAVVAGPGWSAITAFDPADGAHWLPFLAAAYTAVHVAMLALNLLFVISRDGEGHAVSIAQSVRIDRLSPAIALFVAAIFWVAMRALVELQLLPEVTAAIGVAAALAVAEALKTRGPYVPQPIAGPAPARAQAAPIVGQFAGLGAYFPIFLSMAVVSAIAWKIQDARFGPPRGGSEPDVPRGESLDFPMEVVVVVSGSLTVLAFGMIAIAVYEGLAGRRARRALVYPAFLVLFLCFRAMTTPLIHGVPPQAPAQASPASAPAHHTLGDRNPVRHAELKRRLESAKVPYSPVQIQGVEYLRVEPEHGEAMKAVLAGIEGPSLPFNRAIRFTTPWRQRDFTDWLTKNGVGWKVVTRNYDEEEYVVWDDVPGYACLTSAAELEKQGSAAGIDYFAIAALNKKSHCLLYELSFAAFKGPGQRDAFTRWLASKNVPYRRATSDGREYIEWTAETEPNLLRNYSSMRATCDPELRRRIKEPGTKSPNPVAAAC